MDLLRASNKPNAGDPPAGDRQKSPVVSVLTDTHLFLHICSFQRGRPYKDWTGDQVIGHGPLHWLYERDDLDHSWDSMDLAAARGDLKAVEYLHHVLSWPIMRCTVRAAAKKGQLGVLQWLYRTEPTLFGTTDDIARLSAEFGHLHVLQWADDAFGFRRALGRYHHHLNVYFVDAVTSGHIDVMNWLYDRFSIEDAKLQFYLRYARRVEALDWIWAKMSTPISENDLENILCDLVVQCPSQVLIWMEERFQDHLPSYYNALWISVRERCLANEDTALKIRYLLKRGITLGRSDALQCFKRLTLTEDFERMYAGYPEYFNPDDALWEEVLRPGIRPSRQHLEWLDSKCSCFLVSKIAPTTLLQDVLAECDENLDFSIWLHSHKAGGRCCYFGSQVLIGRDVLKVYPVAWQLKKLQWVYTTSGIGGLHLQNVIRDSIARGDLKILHWLEAIIPRHQPTLFWTCNSGCACSRPWNSYYIRKTDSTCLRGAIAYALLHGRVRSIRWLFQHHPPTCSDSELRRYIWSTVESIPNEKLYFRNWLQRQVASVFSKFTRINQT